MSKRRGDWIQTYTGRAVYPLDVRVSDIDIVDVAHALSMLCRYGGHSRFFYSVAEHCVLLSHAVPKHLAYAALLHDAAEAYLVDVPRPIKGALGGYREIEADIMVSVCAAMGVSQMHLVDVEPYDRRILSDEMPQVMAPPPKPWKDMGEKLGVQITGLDPATAKGAFLKRFYELRR